MQNKNGFPYKPGQILGGQKWRHLNTSHDFVGDGGRGEGAGLCR